MRSAGHCIASKSAVASDEPVLGTWYQCTWAASAHLKCGGAGGGECGDGGGSGDHLAMEFDHSAFSVSPIQPPRWDGAVPSAGGRSVGMLDAGARRGSMQHELT